MDGLRIAAVLLALAVTAAGGVGVGLLLSASEDDDQESVVVGLAEARPGELTDELVVRGRTRAATLLSLEEQRTGVVTDVRISVGETIEPPMALYAVDGRVVVAARLDMPLYRPLEVGVQGSDVRSLEMFLDRQGYRVLPDGRDVTVDDSFTSVTAAAVRRWQDDLDSVVDGRVEPTDLRLLRRTGVVSASALDVGSFLTAGEVLTLVEPGVQAVIEVAPQVASDLRQGEQVRVFDPLGDLDTTGEIVRIAEAPAIEEGTDTASMEVAIEIDGTELSEDRGVTIEIPRGRVVAESLVPAVAVLGGTDRDATVVVAAAPGGRPAAAVSLDELSDLEVRPVDVVGSAAGLAAVDGVAPGETVVVLNESDEDAAIGAARVDGD